MNGIERYTLNTEGMPAHKDIIPILYEILCFVNENRYEETDKYHLRLESSFGLTGSFYNNRYETTFDEYSVFIALGRLFQGGREHKLPHLVDENQEHLINDQMRVAYSVIEPNGGLIGVNLIELIGSLNKEDVITKYGLKSIGVSVGVSEGKTLATIIYEYKDELGGGECEKSFDSYESLLYYLGTVGIKEVLEYYRSVKTNRA